MQFPENSWIFHPFTRKESSILARPRQPQQQQVLHQSSWIF
jgi:hypothetical protein